MQSGWADQTNKVQQRKKERWFEIEVILYKANSEAGLSNESWSKDTQLKIPAQAIDFLQSSSEPEPLTIEKTNLIAQNVAIGAQNKAPELNTSALDTSDPNHSNSGRTNLLDPSLGSERPFRLLNKKDRQLTGEANRISRSNNYTLVTHFSWRQPVFSRRNSQPVRIAGGFDYQETFEYSGSKKVDPAYLDLQATLKPQLTQEQLKTQNAEQNFKPSKSYIEPPASFDSASKMSHKTQSNAGLVTPEASLPSVDQNRGGSGLQTESKFAPVPLSWVPEIDGSMLVYIQRNYLHIDAALFYRLPFKEEVSALDLTNTVISFEGGLSGFANPSENIVKTLPKNTLIDANITSPTGTAYTTPREDLDQTTSFSQPKAHQTDNLSWRLDDDFLARKTEKIYITRLFNYPLKQTRRLRSGELHYFDHPLIGMLVMIRPYERNLKRNLKLNLEPGLEQDLEQPKDTPLNQKVLSSVSLFSQSSDTIPTNQIRATKPILPTR